MFLLVTKYRIMCSRVFRVCPTFTPELFFVLKISLTFTFVVTYAHHNKKKVTIKLETLICVRCLTGVLIGICPSMTFSNNRDMIEL